MDKKNGAYVMTTSSGKEILYGVGNITGSFPFLTETESGLIVTPFYLMEGNKIGMSNIGNNGITYSGKDKVLIKVDEVEPLIKNLRLPTVALNITEAHYKKVLKHSEEFKGLSYKRNGIGITVFVPFLAFGDDAIMLYEKVLKGDTITIFGELKKTSIRGVSKTVVACWVTDIQHLRVSQKNLKGVG